MIEVEFKAPANHGRVEPVLQEIGEKKEVLHQVDTYYSAPHRDFNESDEALRLRMENGETILTYKGPKIDSGSKSRLEHEVQVESLDVMENILESLGFTEFQTVTKNRTVYEVNGYTVLLDDVEGLGEYVEVETEVDAGVNNQEYRDGVEGARNLIERLGIDPSGTVRESYLELLCSLEE